MLGISIFTGSEKATPLTSLDVGTRGDGAGTDCLAADDVASDGVASGDVTLEVTAGDVVEAGVPWPPEPHAVTNSGTARTITTRVLTFLTGSSSVWSSISIAGNSKSGVLLSGGYARVQNRVVLEVSGAFVEGSAAGDDS